jgi:5-methylthioadenosine/S-adenosylhomocysteine deaminase
LNERRIIRGAKILAMDGRRVLRRGDMSIDGGTIAAIGGVDSPAGALIFETSSILLPGFVQAHLHLDQALLDRSFVADVDPWKHRIAQLGPWTSRADEDALEVQAAFAFASGLCFGATTFADGGREMGRRAGIAAALAFGARLIATVDATRRDVGRELEALAAFIAERDERQKVSLAIWIGDAERTSIARMRQAAKLSVERGLPLIAHLGALPGDKGGLSRLDRAGAIGKNLVLCHARGDALRFDARRIAQAGVSVVLTPASDLLAGAPSPPIDLFVEVGLNLALGSDTNATRTGFDPLLEARLLFRMLADRITNPATLALEIATKGGARAFGLPVGAIEVGRRADLVAIDAEVSDDDAESLAEAVLERRDRVRSVWIDGEVVAADGRPVRGVRPKDDAIRAVRAKLSEPEPAIARLARKVQASLQSSLASRKGWHRGRLF